MTFRNILTKANQNFISPMRLLVAADVDAIFDTQLTDEQFEDVCHYVLDWVSNTTAHSAVVVNVLQWGLQDHHFTLDDVANFDDKVKDYINQNIY